MTPSHKEESSPIESALSSPVVSAISELAGSLLKLAQDRIAERVEETANRITHNAVVTFTIVFVGIIGGVFVLTGFSLWLGSISHLGAWFGLLVVGILLFIVSLVVGLIRKK
ncbi:MAG: phage holin family protein [Parcubacteria group bacterium]|jgi:TRAP-type uncharacterized transport system fused permease subunit